MGAQCTTVTQDVDESAISLSSKSFAKHDECAGGTSVLTSEGLSTSRSNDGSLYDHNGKKFTIDNDVADFILLSHDVIREVTKRCEDAINTNNRKRFQRYWHELVHSFLRLNKISKMFQRNIIHVF